MEETLFIPSYNKHYERIDENGYVIKGLSNAFEQPLETDICVNEEGERHYNPTIFDEKRCHLIKYVEDVRTETTEEERLTEFNTFPLPPKTEIELLQEDNMLLMVATTETYEKQESDNMLLMLATTEMFEKQESDNMVLMLAVTEMYEEIQLLKGGAV